MKIQFLLPFRMALFTTFLSLVLISCSSGKNDDNSSSGVTPESEPCVNYRYFFLTLSLFRERQLFNIDQWPSLLPNKA